MKRRATALIIRALFYKKLAFRTQHALEYPGRLIRHQRPAESDSPRTHSMCKLSGSARFILSIVVLIVPSGFAFGQRPAGSEFGPVVTAYLGYLNNEQEVVDDRASRKEITTAYYRRNSNRIHALRQMAIRLVRQSGNDYVPELEAVTVDEFRTIFEHPPQLAGLRPSEVFANKFRFLGAVHSGET